MSAELEAVDRLLDDPRFFEPFREWFDPVLGRPSIPIETYLRLMFLKHRYRLGFETLCGEVSDSISWLRFARIPIGETAPHPSTLMKITTKVGSTTIEALNAELVAAGVEAGLVDVSWLRADTTVVPANIKYPTDSGLLTKGIAKISRLVTRIQATGVASRTTFDDRVPAARQGAHRIGSKLRRRNETAKAEVLEITGELAEVAQGVCDQAKRVLRNGRRTRHRTVKRLWRMLADLDAAIAAVEQIIAQTRLRISGVTPTSATRRVSLHDGDARPIRKGSLARPTQFGYTGQVTDNRDGIVLDYEVEAGMPAEAPRLAPAIERIIEAVGTVPDAVTADRGYGQSSVDVELGALGVDMVAVLRKGKVSARRHDIETSPAFVELVKWRTGSEGRIAALKRQHGWDRTGLAGLEGTRVWCGWGVLNHNLTKIAALGN